MKNFFRKVAFGIGSNEEVPSDPLNWALNQVDEIPQFSWTGKILKEKELRGHYRDWVYGCLLYTSPSPRDRTRSRMPSSA